MADDVEKAEPGILFIVRAGERIPVNEVQYMAALRLWQAGYYTEATALSPFGLGNIDDDDVGDEVKD